MLVELDQVELVEPVEGLEQRQLGLVLGLARPCAAGSRSGPAGRSSPGCRSAERRRRGRVVPSISSAVGYFPRHTSCGSRRLVARRSGPCGSASIAGSTNSCASAVGMLVRLSRVLDRIDRGRALSVPSYAAGTRSRLIEVEQVGVADDRRVGVERVDRFGEAALELERGSSSRCSPSGRSRRGC